MGVFASDQPRRTFHGYAAPTRFSPQWRVQALVFQAGAARLRNGSLTGGGQIYGREYQGYQQPLLSDYTPGVLSITGGGQIPAYPASLQALFGGASGTGS